MAGSLLSHSVANGESAGASVTVDFTKFGAFEVTVRSCVSGPLYTATSIGDNEAVVVCTVV